MHESSMTFLAILTAMPDEEVESTIERIASRLPAYGRLTASELLTMVTRARKTGYVLNDVRTLSGVTAIGVPIFDPNGRPIGAISISAIAARMTATRQRELLEVLRREIRTIEKQLARDTDKSLDLAVDRVMAHPELVAQLLPKPTGGDARSHVARR